MLKFIHRRRLELLLIAAVLLPIWFVDSLVASLNMMGGRSSGPTELIVLSGSLAIGAVCGVLGIAGFVYGRKS